MGCRASRILHSAGWRWLRFLKSINSFTLTRHKATSMKTKAILTAFITLAALCGYRSTSSAATITATGSGGWFSTTPDGPWPGGVVPAATDDAIITSGVNVGSAVTINNLTINGGGTFFNSGVLTVSGALTL